MPPRKLKPDAIARLAVDAASEKQASDIVLLDLNKSCDFADYFVIMSADSSRQTSALVRELDASMKKKGVLRSRLEGDSKSGWVVADYGDVVIHIFGPEEREIYELESAWEKATEVVRIQ